MKLILTILMVLVHLNAEQLECRPYTTMKCFNNDLFMETIVVIEHCDYDGYKNVRFRELTTGRVIGEIQLVDDPENRIECTYSWTRGMEDGR
jgi:hypothetical protein